MQILCKKEWIFNCKVKILLTESRVALRGSRESDKGMLEDLSLELLDTIKLNHLRHNSKTFFLVILFTGIKMLILNHKQSSKFKISFIYAQLVSHQDHDLKFKHLEQAYSTDKIGEPIASNLSKGNKKLKTKVNK